jgi:3-oxoacyl-[acyl-carrier-protein] synthase II
MEIISPLGCGLAAHMEGVRTGRSGSGPIHRFDASSFMTTFGCEVTDDLSPLYKKIYPDIVETFMFDRKMELFACCMELLRERIEVVTAAASAERIGIFTGVGTETLSDEHITSFTLVDEQECLNLFNRHNTRTPYVNRIVNPSQIVTNYAASVCGATGTRHTNLSACAASAQALGWAFEAISSGQCDCALVGGVDSTINPFVLTAFSQLDMISTRNDMPQTASRPFDKTRDGFVPGEGTGVVLLANELTAGKVGDVQTRLAGYGSSLDAYNITSPHPEGLGAQYAMKRCLQSAGWAAETVEYVNAHGTSTQHNDRMECSALKAVFGKRLDQISVSSTKSQIGHLIAAAGIVEFITTVAAINEGILPPSINVRRQDDACRVSLVTESGKNVKIKRAISNSFALAGQNAVLAIEAV